MHKAVEHVTTMGEVPGLSGGDIFKYLPLLVKVIEAFGPGTGTFSTNTPVGKRWVRVQDHLFEGESTDRRTPFEGESSDRRSG